MLHKFSMAIAIAATFYMFGVAQRAPVKVACQAYKWPEYFDTGSLRGGDFYGPETTPIKSEDRIMPYE